jgi:hypothetical protein
LLVSIGPINASLAAKANAVDLLAAWVHARRAGSEAALILGQGFEVEVPMRKDEGRIDALS